MYSLYRLQFIDTFNEDSITLLNFGEAFGTILPKT